MEIFRHDATLPEALRGGVIAIGNFDGLHRGHQQLVRLAQDKAKALGKPCGLLTFEPHPRGFFRPAEPLFRLTPEPLKLSLAQALGLDFAVVMDFGADLARMEAEDFIRDALGRRLGAAHVVTGYDFHFGHGRKGNPDLLRAQGAKLGFGVSVLDQVTDDGGLAPFSSSSIRAELRAGHVEEAARQLGYWWTVQGEVVKGDQRGRTIGYPTANVVLEPGTDAAEGIYATRVKLRGQWLGGAAYIGTRPTFDTDRKFLEIFLFDFAGDIYGETLTAEFVGFIRPDRKFDGLEPLLAQMKADCEAARRILAGLAAHDPMREFPLGRAGH